MFGAILTATNTSFQKGITFCHSIYVKLLAFIFEQPVHGSNYFLLVQSRHIPKGSDIQ